MNYYEEIKNEFINNEINKKNKKLSDKSQRSRNKI